jgi:uncharacterized protein YgbK (DUF1537 family)
VWLLDLKTIRAGPAALRRRLDQAEGITIADAETDEDLIALARAASQSTPRVLCGSAGLARQLAPLLSPATAAPTVTIPPRSGPVLVVAGSQHAATVSQLQTLSEAGIPVVRPAQETIDDPHSPVAGIVAEVAARLAAGQTIALTTSGLAPCPHGGHAVAVRLAEIATAPAVRDQLGGLVLTGGDVAAAVSSALEAAALRLGGEIAPGLPWGILEGGALPDLPIVTKAGSFGGDHALLRCIDRLESLRR